MTREEAIAYFEQNVEIMEQPPIHWGSAVAIQEWAKRCDRLYGAYRWAIAALREQEELARRAHDVASDKQVNASNKRLTNADHIRSMTDEELAWRMMQLNFCPPNIDEYKVCGKDANCHQCWIDWLSQPYKEATDD